MNFDSQEISLMRLRGLPGYILNEREFPYEDYLSNYTSTLEKLKPLPVKKQDQIDQLKLMFAKPDHAPFLACISSEPNDLRAKILASKYMQRCIQKDVEVQWHTLIGSYKDDLRDNPKYWKKRIKALIITNFVPDSTNVKYEKLRDLLEIYSDIPRLVITTQCEPFALFNAMGIPLNYGIHLKSKRCRRTL